MGTFIDRHQWGSLTSELRRQLAREARAASVDANGVCPVGHWYEDGWAYCVLEGPTIAAFCRHHLARGLDCLTVRSVEGLRGTRPISPEDDRLVRAAIENYWRSGRLTAANGEA